MSDMLASSRSSPAGTAAAGADTATATSKDTATATTSTNTTDGPTLPILSAASTNRKRKRPAGDAQNGSAKAKPGKQSEAAITEAGRIHSALYTPWTLLPPKQRRLIEEHGGEKEGWEVLVWSKNQKVRSGVRRLLALLRDEREAGCATEEKGKRRGVVVSAQDAGTVKLVGGFELVRRILAQRNGEGMDGQGKEARWYVYTVLSSVQVPRPKQGDLEAGTGTVPGVEGERMDVDLDLDSTQPGGEDADPDPDKEADDAVQATPTKTTPVLSLWITQTRIPGWADVFGEMEVVICGGL